MRRLSSLILCTCLIPILIFISCESLPTISPSTTNATSNNITLLIPTDGRTVTPEETPKPTQPEDGEQPPPSTEEQGDGQQKIFCETWESAQVGEYIPNYEPYPDITMIQGDLGEWKVHDTASFHFHEKGKAEPLSTNSAKIIESNGNKYLKITSTDCELIHNEEDCVYVENIWIEVAVDCIVKRGMTLTFEANYQLGPNYRYEWDEANPGQKILVEKEITGVIAIIIRIPQWNRHKLEYVIAPRDCKGYVGERTSRIPIRDNNGTYKCNIIEDLELAGSKYFNNDNEIYISTIYLMIEEPGWVTFDNICIK